MIEFIGVSKVYQSQNQPFHALHNITFSINEKDLFGIVGMSGAGKSTILKLLTGLIRPDQGEILVRNQSLTNYSEQDWQQYRRQIGVIHQGYQLLMQKTVFQNIALPPQIQGFSKEEQYRRVYELLNLVGLTQKAKEFPNHLSGGEKQRVAIARALANQPKILLCDEPTSALDLLTTYEIVSLLQTIHQTLGVCIVIISHELSLIKKITNRFLILNHGEIAEIGWTHSLFESPKSTIGIQLMERM